ncbi:MAG: GGDEF domain-containing protein [Deltaproteobacteria bacterium]|nr:GGDEF domain-containing protein [Deltaproteobacteria bacterium]
MAAKKNSILVASPLIACNSVCAALKERGLPYDSVWLQIGHFIRNLDGVSCLSHEQQTLVKESFEEYLKLVSNKDKAQVESLGRDFLDEVDKLKKSGTARALKEEQDFNAQLLDAIGKNLHQLAAIISKADACGMIDTIKADTLKSIKSATSRNQILHIVEESFTELNEKAKTTQEKMELSMESLLVLESNAIIDKLTGIFNRRFFDQELPKIVQTYLDKKGRVPFSLMLLDIDRFKEINDTHGHFIGDRAQQKVAAIVQNNCRAGIDSPIRLGGDEFALFLIGTNEKNGLKKGETIRMEISKKPMTFMQRETDGDPHNVSITVEVSIGVCELDIAWKDIAAGDLNRHAIFCKPPDDDPMYKLTCMLAEGADQALYEAKEMGRNQVRAFRGD